MARAEITTPEIISEESVIELSLRPQRLAEFIGQAKVKENLRIAIAAAVARKEPLDHTLFHGPPGLGQTTPAAPLDAPDRPRPRRTCAAPSPRRWRARSRSTTRFSTARRGSGRRRSPS